MRNIDREHNRNGLDSKMQKGRATTEAPTSRLALAEHRQWERASAPHASVLELPLRSTTDELGHGLTDVHAFVEDLVHGAGDGRVDVELLR